MEQFGWALDQIKWYIDREIQCQYNCKDAAKRRMPSKIDSEWVKRTIENIQTDGDWFWLLRDVFPESMKGECAKQLWADTNFKYGMEYGALVILKFVLYDSLSETKIEAGDV